MTSPPRIRREFQITVELIRPHPRRCQSTSATTYIESATTLLDQPRGLRTYEHLAPEDSLHSAEYAYNRIHHELGDAVHAEIMKTDFKVVFRR